MNDDEVTAAFGPDSIGRRALLPFAGRDVVIRSFGFGLPPGVKDATGDGWLTPEVPVLVRGELRIIPLAWWGANDRGDNPDAAPGEIFDFATRVVNAGMYANGPWRQIDLFAEPADSLGSYAAALRASGVSRADRFVSVPDRVGLAVVWAGDQTAGFRSLAVHVVPENWVFPPVAGAPVDGIDARWSWADVVALRGSGQPETDRTAHA
jgi:hypothetical protein